VIEENVRAELVVMEAEARRALEDNQEWWERWLISKGWRT